MVRNFEYRKRYRNRASSLTRRCNVSHHQKMIEKMISTIKARRGSYGSVLVISAIVKQDEIWKNSVTKILPLHKSDSYTLRDKLDYGDFVLFEELISLNKLIEIIKKLPEKGTAKVMLGEYEVQVSGDYLQDGHKYDSGDDYLNVGWFFERYHYRSSTRIQPNEPIVSKDLPLFPDLADAVDQYIGIDLRRYSEAHGILVCLPRYGARIEEVNIGSNEIRLKVQPRETSLENLVGKLYCESGKEVKHADIEFEDDRGTALIGFMPDKMYVMLVSKTDNKVVDSRRYYSSWESPPKGVAIDVPEYEIKELILRGETETVEFKEKIVKPEKIAETTVAFANNRGGVILFSVNDSSKIVGLDEGKHGETITNILRSHCNPQPRYEISKRQIDGKDVILIHVEEGRDKPYFVRERGPYIRAHATNRLMTRQEMDEIHGQKQSGYLSAY